MPANVSVFRRMPASYTSTLSLHDALPISELDTRFVPGAAGCPHARDFARTVPLGWSDARGRRRTARTARNDCLVLDPPATVRVILLDGPGGEIRVLP